MLIIYILKLLFMSSDFFLLSKYMSKNVVIFSPNQTVLEVMELLQKHRISGGPVLNEEDKLSE